MDFFVEGEAPEFGHQARTAYRGWVLASSYTQERKEIDLLISDESAGVGTERLRTVPSVSVSRHHTAPKPPAGEPVR